MSFKNPINNQIIQLLSDLQTRSEEEKPFLIAECARGNETKSRTT